ncbi:hypothetical protein CDAR_483731 [Caerostris darwini]|uniref:Uncharacterized protein n=1 Tax=Caerostris darwini TaxID=1538125 RepID=A0AAV4TTJ2_9ARAC|nr:hypothetical protein CDAR_483731 [Caerostris darwini]
MRFKPLLWMLKTKPQAKTPDSVGIEIGYDSETAVILSLSVTDAIQTTVIDGEDRTSPKTPNSVGIEFDMTGKTAFTSHLKNIFSSVGHKHLFIRKNILYQDGISNWMDYALKIR